VVCDDADADADTQKVLKDVPKSHKNSTSSDHSATTTSDEVEKWDIGDPRLAQLDVLNTIQVKPPITVHDFLVTTRSQLKTLIPFIVNFEGYQLEIDLFDYMHKSCEFPGAFERVMNDRKIDLRAAIVTAIVFVDTECKSILRRKFKSLHRTLAIDLVLNCYFAHIQVIQDFASFS
jgi:hypothetical protein